MMHDLAKALKERLHPYPYDQDFSPSGCLDFLLLRKSALPGGRYAFGFKGLGADSLKKTFEEARSDAAAFTKSMWLFRQVGLYLVLCGPESKWLDCTSHAPVDRTGLHKLIVQAVHFIDPDSGAEHLSQSAWGPVRFGGVDSISEMIKQTAAINPQHEAEGDGERRYAP